MSVDPPETNRTLGQRLNLPFPILSDPEAKAIRDFGLLHGGGGPDSSDIAIPAQVLISRENRVLWKRVSARFQDRPAPHEVVAAIRRLLRP